MPGVRFAGDMEVLVCVFGELCKEEGQECVDVFASRDGVGDRGSTVREADVDGLVEEDDARVGVPAVGITNDLEVFVDGSRAKFQKQAGERGAAWASIDPENYGVVLGIIS